MVWLNSYKHLLNILTLKRYKGIRNRCIIVHMSDNNYKKLHDYARSEHIPVMKMEGMTFLLQFLREHESIRDVLEIGTAIGLSSIEMAKIRWDMDIDTLEINPEMVKQAEKNIQEVGLEDRIHIHLMDAAQFETDRLYDFIFMDAAKSQYTRYLEHFYKNMYDHTYILIDNLSFHGIVEDESLTHNRSTRQMVHKIKKFKDRLASDPRFETAFYDDIGDGIALVKKVKDA